MLLFPALLCLQTYIPPYSLRGERKKGLPEPCASPLATFVPQIPPSLQVGHLPLCTSLKTISSVCCLTRCLYISCRSPLRPGLLGAPLQLPNCFLPAKLWL